jgi:hypothetical protein
MRIGLFNSEAQGNIFSLGLSAWSVLHVNVRARVSKRACIEKPYRINPKLSLYSWNASVYGPTLTRLATKLRQTKGGLK